MLEGFKKIRKKLFIWIIGILLCSGVFGAIFRTFAGEQDTYVSTKKGELVFLLDTSVSMNTQDLDRRVIEAIRRTAYILPSDYSLGLVAYNTEIQAAVPLSTDLERLEQQLDSLYYAGYTNAGEGLDQAVRLFSQEDGVERSIILLTDGEIDMPNQQQKETSRIQYTEAMTEAASLGIPMYIVAIGTELTSPKLHIFDGAEVTGGAVYWEGQSGSLNEILERILKERLEIPWKEVSVRMGETDGEWVVELPFRASRSWLLLDWEGESGTVMAECGAERKQITEGKEFAVIELEHPSSDFIRIWGGESWNKVHARLMTEYSAKIQINVQYRREELEQTAEEIKKKVPPRYEHFADIVIEAVDESGNQSSLWEREEFQGRKVSYTLNGAVCQGVIEKGKLSASIPADDIEEVDIQVDMTGFGDVWQVRQAPPVKIVKTPDPIFQPEPDYRLLWGILGILAVGLVMLVLWGRKKDTTIIYMEQAAAARMPEKPMVIRDGAYSGKLNLYVVRTRNEEDIPPQTYRLFGRAPGRIVLKQILDTCNISCKQAESGNIVFCPGPDHSLVIQDQSEHCTVMRGAEILKKGKGYPIYYNEKITVTFYEEDMEIELHYKNLKPSERG